MLTQEENESTPARELPGRKPGDSSDAGVDPAALPATCRATPSYRSGAHGESSLNIQTQEAAGDAGFARQVSLKTDLGILDTAHQRLLDFNHDVAMEMRELVRVLRDYRKCLGKQEWERWVEHDCLTHPIREVIHRDPFTARAFSKPRGYPGDAVMLDYIYHGGASVSAEGIGARIHQYTTNGPSPRAVRFRRDLLAKRIGEIAQEFSQPHVLAIAAGHLREAEICPSVREGRIGRFVAVDQDAESLATITQDYACYGIETVSASVKDILSGQRTFNNFHFVYAAGLFDYLAEPVAKRLVRSMLRMLVPGGRLLIANFLPDIEDVGYMESFMDWHLIFRTEAELLGVFSAVPRDEIGNVELSRDPYDNIAFAEVRRL